MGLKTTWFYYVGRWLVRLLLCLLTSCEIKGREHIPSAGPFIVVANHLGLADPPLVAVAIHRKLRFMAKEELFRCRIAGYFIRGFGAFPVRRNRVDREMFREVKTTLEAGWGLVIFPEGKRSRKGSLMKAYPGTALLACRYGVPLLPVAITGTQVLDKGIAWIFRRPKIVVRIGEPFTLPNKAKNERNELETLTAYIMTHIAEMLPLHYQGYYAVKLADVNTAAPDRSSENK